MNEPRNSHAASTRTRIGSRGSQLALWQANHISALLRQRGLEVEIQVIHTTGDKITDVALAKVGTKGMFTKEIEEALAEGRVDLAVHSLKDLPTEIASEFEIAAITKREDPRDVLCSRKFSSIEELPQGARVGTSSLRRQAQLKAVRLDLEIHPLRGNVDTRLRKLEAGDYDAVILAAAGLNRLGKTEFVKQVLPPEIMCPAAGQGALAIEIRRGDKATQRHLEFLDDASARATTTCERALLEKMGGGCQVPIGALAQVRDRVRNGGLHLDAIVASPDGTQLLRESRDGSDPLELGQSRGRIAAAARRRRDPERSLRSQCSRAPATMSKNVLLQLLGGKQDASKLRRLVNLWPPFIGAGIRITHIAPDMRAIDVEMKLRFWNANYVGTHFGGSLFAMTDPFYMLMLMANLGRDYIVWDKAATIRYKRPGKGTVRAEFRLAESQIENIREKLRTLPKYEPVFSVQVKSDDGAVIAEVEKVLHIKRKPNAV